jgi:ribonucleotide reductase alpha subunit
MNLFIDKPSISKLAAKHIYSWKNVLKTGIYYLRTKPAVNAVKVTLPPKAVAPSVPASAMLAQPSNDNNFLCSSESGVCFSCSS